MIELWAAAGSLLSLVGAALLYLASPHQQIVRQPVAGRAFASAGSCALLVALVLLLGVFGRATAIFIWFTLAMLVWSCLPVAAAWVRHRREAAR